MNPAMMLTGTVMGFLVCFMMYQPTELKSKIASQESEIKSCTVSLSEANQQIKGMLMNK